MGVQYPMIAINSFRMYIVHEPGTYTVKTINEDRRGLLVVAIDSGVLLDELHLLLESKIVLVLEHQDSCRAAVVMMQQ